MNLKKTFSLLGPGLLYAAAAVGVSHLVQSTRGGASYGLDLIPFLILAMVIKYPFFEFAPRYTNATGKDLITGYRDIGKWAIILFAIFTVSTMFAISAAVVIVTAGVVGYVFHLSLDPLLISGILMIICVVILALGKYSLLDGVIKYVITILAITTIAAVISALGLENDYQTLINNFSFQKRTDIFFLIAFIGWMPSPVDVSVWHSLWSKEKHAEHKVSVKEGRIDFNIGYIGTGIVALAFLLLGALIMHGSTEQLSANGAQFSGQLISMYTTTIGNWAYPIIAIAALATMFSTSITVLDAYPRVMTRITTHYFNRTKISKNKMYWIWMAIGLVGTTSLLSILSHSMRFMVDLATTMSFVTAPVIALLNLKAVTGKNFPAENKPSKGLLRYAHVGIIFLTLFSLFYIVYIIL